MHHPHGLGHHHGCQSIWLTGAEIGAGKRNSISVDQLIAEQTAPHTRFASLELSDTGRSLAYNRDGISLPAETKPSEVFRRLLEAPPGGAAKEREGLRRRGSVLDAVLEEARDLERKVGTEDKGRLDQYLKNCSGPTTPGNSKSARSRWRIGRFGWLLISGIPLRLCVRLHDRCFQAARGIG